MYCCLYGKDSRYRQFLADNDDYQIGDMAWVPVGPNCKSQTGEITKIEYYTAKTLSVPLVNLEYLIGKYVDF